MDLVEKTAFIYLRNCENIQNLKNYINFTHTHTSVCVCRGKRLSLSDFSGGTSLSGFPNTNVVRLRGANDYIHLPMKMEPIRSSETSAIKTQTPGNYSKRNTLQLKNGESLKTTYNKLVTACQHIRQHPVYMTDSLQCKLLNGCGNHEYAISMNIQLHQLP